MRKQLVRPPHSLEAKVRKHSISRKIAKFLGSRLASAELSGALFCITTFSHSDFEPYLVI